MHELQTARMPLHQIDAGNAAVMNLLEELLEVSPTLVPYPCLREQTASCAALVNTNAEIYILAEAHLRETTQLLVERPADAHIEGTGIELLVHLFLAAAYATGSEEGRHTIVNGLLHIGKTLVGTVGAAKSINLN